MIAIDPICGMPINTETANFKAEIRDGAYYFCSEGHRRSFLEGRRIAYFSMEIGIRSDIPTYSGGLGVLAGDSVRSSADLRIPLVAVTLVSRSGYFRQQITERGDQIEHRRRLGAVQFYEIASRYSNCADRWQRCKDKILALRSSESDWRACSCDLPGYRCPRKRS